MYFVRSGVISLPGNSCRLAGYDGRSWGSSAYSTIIHYAFDLRLDSINTYPSAHDHRYYGYTLRVFSLYASFMYFVRSGNIFLPTGSIRFASAASNSWSSSTHPTNKHNTFYLAFTTIIYPSYSDNQHNGFLLHHNCFSMYFVRSGRIYLPYNSLRFAGLYNLLWSSVAYPADTRYALALYFDSTITSPSNSNDRYDDGFPLQLISMSLPYISSVVAKSIFLTAQSVTLATIIITIPPPRNPPTFVSSPPPPSIHPAHILQAAAIAIQAIPSVNNHSHIYFIRSDFIVLISGSLQNASRNGGLWSPTAYATDDRYAFRLAFTATSTYTSTNDPRYYGFSLRRPSP